MSLYKDHHQVIMGSSHAELTLGLMPYMNNEGEGGARGSNTSKLLELEQYVESLEAERKKIEAFKRELPFCMTLLTSAIEASKEKLANNFQNSPSNSKDQEVISNHTVTPINEDINIDTIFRPLNRSGTPKGLSSEEASPRINGTTTQTTKFWSLEEAYAHGEEMVSAMGGGDITYCNSSSIMKPIPISCERRGGAFMPFLKTKTASTISAVEQQSPCEVSSPAIGDKEDYTERTSSPNTSQEHYPAIMVTNTNSKTTPPTRANNATQHSRKQRRCWSPELHRRFVHALHQLGGSQCATPKQIRELMNVDDLTNDEVKSHLQKYRLHTRRQVDGSFGKTTMSHDVPQLVVLGGIWVPQGYGNEGSKQQKLASNLPSDSHMYIHSGEIKFRGDSSHELYSEEDNSEAEDGRVY